MAPSAPASSEPAALDGRVARSRRTRLAIIDSLRSLHQDDDLRPTAARVAERAGVSLRTVWQHFDDLESLLVEAGRRDFDAVMAHVLPIDAAEPFADRLRQLVDQRVDLFEALAPVWRAARLQEPFSPQIRRNRDRLLTVGREQLMQAFATELDALPPAERPVVLDAVQVAASWATWEALRGDLGLPVDDARQTFQTLLARLLSGPPT
jgi:AcrR family transcriptional regulator